MTLATWALKNEANPRPASRSAAVQGSMRPPRYFSGQNDAPRHFVEGLGAVRADGHAVAVGALDHRVPGARKRRESTFHSNGVSGNGMSR